jgi:hypothetical protein
VQCLSYRHILGALQIPQYPVSLCCKQAIHTQNLDNMPDVCQPRLHESPVQIPISIPTSSFMIATVIRSINFGSLLLANKVSRMIRAQFGDNQQISSRRYRLLTDRERERERVCVCVCVCVSGVNQVQANQRNDILC